MKALGTALLALAAIVAGHIAWRRLSERSDARDLWREVTDPA